MPGEKQEKALVLEAVDPARPLPLYHQVAVDLRRLIAGGTLGPGDVVPPEQDLARRYGVSRQTVRAALGRLVDEGLIARHAGRGTFVRPRPDRDRFYLDRSFTQQMVEMGRTAHSRVLEQTTGTIESGDPGPLQEHHGAPCLRLTRLRFGDDEPIGLQHLTLITRQCPGVEAFDFMEASLYDVLARAYRLVITEIRHTIGAAVADRAQAVLLQVAPGDPLLVVHTTTFLADGQLIEYTTSYYRADRYEYSTRHTISDFGF